MKKKLLIVVLVVLIILALLIASYIGVFAYQELQIRRLLKSLTPQGDTPCYVMYNTLYDGEISVDIEKSISGELNEVFAISDDKCYFVYSHYNTSDTTTENWCIAYIDINSSKVTTCYDGVFRSVRDGNKKGYIFNNISLPVALRNGFYYEGIIYLTDFEKMVQYDIFNDVITETDYSKFVYPEMSTAKIVDCETIELYDSNNNIKKIVTLSEMALNNTEINKLYKLKDLKISSGESLLYDFFDTVQVINYKLYILGRVLSRNGETYVVMLEYDCNNDTSKYVHWLYKGDTISNEVYFVRETQGDGSPVLTKTN